MLSGGMPRLTRFGAIHESYALGTVILEIGLWRPLLSLSGSIFARVAEAASSVDTAAAKPIKEKVKAQLLQHAVTQLPITPGRVYSEVVGLRLSDIHLGF